uniref:Chromosome 11 open reading frame 97 n=1 Tax=Calidris pygmaea TaxID=425635 RepID=A0A8C3JMF7_9CHAR
MADPTLSPRHKAPGSLPQPLAPRRGAAPRRRRAGRAVTPRSAPPGLGSTRRSAALPAARSGDQPDPPPPAPALAPVATGPPVRKKVVYVEPSRRVKEILEEELSFRKEACHVKHPAAAALEGIWSVKKNFSLGSMKTVSQNRNGLLLQPQFYSRHAGTKSKSQ